MIFRQLFEPLSSTYTYLIGCEETGKAILIDPVIASMDRDIEELKKLNLTLEYSIDTHIHADHITGSLHLKEKLKIYRDAGIPVYFGGTLFEAFMVRGQFDDYRKVLDEFGMEYAEVSDGSVEIEHDVKCEYIRQLSSQVTVISEVGSKDEKKIFAPYKWIKLMKAEIEAGAWKVIAEAREGGNVGLYRDSGEVRQGLVDEILTQIPEETIIWEAPQKAQQVWFIQLIGANVNLGNIAPAEVIPLETIRLGLRGDTFSHFLNMNK